MVSERRVKKTWLALSSTASGILFSEDDHTGPTERFPGKTLRGHYGDEIGRRVRKVITEDAQQRMKLSCMKSWSVRVIRWMDMMREEMFMMDTTSWEAKNQLKLFIKH